MTQTTPPYEALLVVSFGGPEGPDDVIPFLENVLRGKPVPRERMLEVAGHYQDFGGVSPLNEQNRQLIASLEAELEAHGPQLPIYFGNRNWDPLLPDTLTQMRDDGVKRALAFFTSAYSSYSGCRQYRENITEARIQVGEGAPEIDKIRVFYNHPLFISANADQIRRAFESLSAENQRSCSLVFTAHSIPLSMASHCSYEDQLEETARLIAEELEWDHWDLVYQSRSGPPSQAWLEPDVCDYLEQRGPEASSSVIVAPIGFLSDHMEVLFDLDTEALEICRQEGVEMVRAATVGTHPSFIRMIRELILERLGKLDKRRALGHFGPSHDVCPENCCRYIPRHPSRPS